MTQRPTVIERAFSLAATGGFETLKDIRMQLKSEGYWNDREIVGGTLVSQLSRLLSQSKFKKLQDAQVSVGGQSGRLL